MNKKVRIIIGIIIVVLILIAIIEFIGFKLTGNLTYKKNNTINIAYLGPLSGNAAAYGIDEKNAFDLAINEINSNGGINDKLIKPIYEDGGCDSKKATNAAQKLININNIKIILGGACSSETLAAAPIAEKNKVILYSSFSSSPDITNAGNYVFRNMPSDNFVGKELVKLIIDENYNRIAIISQNTDYAQSFKKLVINEFKKYGKEKNIIFNETYNSDEKDFRTILLKLKLKKPDGIILNPQTYKTGGIILKQAKELNINAQYYGGPNAWSGNEIKKIAGKSIIGLKVVDNSEIDKSKPKVKEFLKRYKKRYGDYINGFLIASKYDSVYIIKNAIEYCKSDKNTVCIKNYLYDMNWYNGLIGKFKFDKNGEDRKSTRLNSSHTDISRMPSSA